MVKYLQHFLQTIIAALLIGLFVFVWETHATVLVMSTKLDDLDARITRIERIIDLYRQYWNKDRSDAQRRRKENGNSEPLEPLYSGRIDLSLRMRSYGNGRLLYEKSRLCQEYNSAPNDYYKWLQVSRL